MVTLQEELTAAQSRLQELQDELTEVRKALQDTQSQLADREVENALIRTGTDTCEVCLSCGSFRPITASAYSYRRHSQDLLCNVNVLVK